MQFRETEVEQLGAILRQHDVPWLQVAVNDAAVVRLVERIRDLDAGLKRLSERKRTLHQQIRKRLPLEVFHDQKVGPVLVPDVVQRADVRMVVP
jgi:hypothetical protein